MLLYRPSTWQVVVVMLALGLASHTTAAEDQQCGQYEIAESMPDQLELEELAGFKPAATHEALIDLIDRSQRSLRIASFYITLTADEAQREHPSARPGLDIMAAIRRAAVERKVRLQVVLDGSSNRGMSNEADVRSLREWGAQVKFLNMTRLMGAGVLHSKFLIGDHESFYVGSSNFDWRSYTQIKEIGLVVRQCEPLAQDLDKIFSTYWLMADASHLPPSMPSELNTTINIDHPFKLEMDDREMQVFLGASPPAFNGGSEANNWNGRTSDIDGLLRIIDHSKRSVDISVMNYNARTAFGWPKRFWPRIDNALRRAASERQVRVRLLFSNWSHVRDEEMMWYRSLGAVNSKDLGRGGIEVRMFQVPAFDDFQRHIPYARVKHDKYMVTERGLYIGTSNWTPDYFINTCGVGVVIEPGATTNGTSSGVIADMRSLFERDFNSKYAQKV